MPLVRAALLRALPPLPPARRMRVPALPGRATCPRVPRLRVAFVFTRPSRHPLPEIYS